MIPRDAISHSDVEKIMLAYDLGEVDEFHAFHAGTVQTNVSVTTDTGRYALRLYENRTAEYVAFEVKLLEELARRQYPCPAPIPDVTGSMFGLFQGKPRAVFTVMAGVHEGGKDHLREAAGAIGRLHVLTRSLQLPEALRDTYDPTSCLCTAEGNLSTLPDQNEVGARLTWFRREAEDIRLPKRLPSGIGHCDPNPTNFLYEDGQLSAVLDFDMAAHIPFIYDVGALLYWWAVHAVRRSLFRVSEKLLRFTRKNAILKARNRSTSSMVSRWSC